MKTMDKKAQQFITEFTISFILGAVIFLALGIIFSNYLQEGFNREGEEITNVITQLEEISDGSMISISVYGVVPSQKFLFITNEAGDTSFNPLESIDEDVEVSVIIKPTSCDPGTPCVCIVSFDNQLYQSRPDDNGNVHPDATTCASLPYAYRRVFADFLPIVDIEDTPDTRSELYRLPRTMNVSNAYITTLGRDATTNVIELYFKREGDFVVSCIEPFICETQLQAIQVENLPETFGDVRNQHGTIQ
jgi:hypothetical protein